jgi:hypothetical protein
MLLTGGASPLTGAPGAVILYAVIGFLVWPAGRSENEEATGIASSPSACGPFGQRGALGVWCGFWTLSAVLWLLPFNRGPGAISAQVSTAAAGEPAWYSHLLLSVSAAIGPHTTVLAWELALVSLVIGLGPLLTRHPAVFLWTGLAIELVYWVVGMSLGGMLTGSGTDPNAGPLVALLALALMPRSSKPVTEAPIRSITLRHPIGVGAVVSATFVVLLLSSTYPVAAPTSSAHSRSSSSLVSQTSMSAGDSTSVLR